MLLNIDAILSSQLVQPVCIHLIILLDLNRFQAGIVLHDRQLALQVLRCLACPGHYGVGSLRVRSRRLAQVRLVFAIHLVLAVLVFHMMYRHRLAALLLRLCIGSLDSTLKRDLRTYVGCTLQISCTVVVGVPQDSQLLHSLLARKHHMA